MKSAKASMRRGFGFASAGVVAAAMLAACSSAATTPPANGTPAPAGISVTGAWARTAPATASAGAAYMVITNNGSAADALLSVSSSIATTVQVHETFVMTPAPSGGTDMSSPVASGGADMSSPAASGAMNGGAMGMRPIDRLDIAAGASVELKPGSYHIMLIGLTKDLVAGDKFQLTLTFEKAGQIVVTADVRAN